MAPYEELQKLVVAGQVDKIKEVVNTLLNSGKAPTEIITEGLVSGLSVVGAKMQSGEMYIPEVIASAHAVKEGMEVLKPLIMGDELLSIYIGKIVIGTVEGDLHNIGKNIVSLLLESTGFEVVDLGIDVPAATFLDAVKREKPDILALSALLTTTVPRMKDTIEALKVAGVRDKVRVIVGGAPVQQDIADSVGADGYAPEASSAVEKAKELMRQR